MGIELLEKAAKVISAQSSVKVLATVDSQGLAYAEEKEFLELTKEGNIIFLELLETSRTYKNFTRSLWFNKNISLTVIGEDKTSYRIIGKPVRILVNGAQYESYYKQVRELLGDVDLAAICVLEPVDVSDITLLNEIKKQDKELPIFIHLDRLLKE